MDKDINNSLKKHIADESSLSIDEMKFKDIATPDNVMSIENGFEFIWDDEIGGTVRITFGELGGQHICIEAEYSWDAVQLYGLIDQWLEVDS